MTNIFGSRYVCLFVDQKTKNFSIILDAETQKKLRQSEVVLLSNTSADEDNLRFSYLQQGAAVNQCTSSGHSCHLPAPRNQCPWIKKVSNCYVDKRSPVASYEGLPTEILRLIFKFLESDDLKNMLLVNKTWKSVAEHPSLWTGFNLPDACKKNAQHLLEFSHLSLFAKLQHLDLAGFSFELQDEHIQLLLDLDLSSIRVGNIDLSKVSDELLSNLVNNSKECDIIQHYSKRSVYHPQYTPLFNLGEKKISAILSEMKDESKLKTFKLSYDTMDPSYIMEKRKLDMASIPSGVLGRAFSKLQVLAFENLFFSSEQLISVFGFGLINLRSLTFRGIYLDAAQTGQLVDLLDRSCQLNYLNLSELDVINIPSTALARAIIKVETVVLEELKIKGDQIEDIFTASMAGDSNMKHLSLIGMNKDLSEVDAEVFAKAVNKLESVALDVDLDEDLIIEMFNVMSLGTNLKTLGMPDNQIAVDSFHYIVEVDAEVLAKALNNLESVRIDFGYDECCFLIYPQLEAFFKQFSLKTNLKRILRKDHEDFPV